MPMVTPKSAAKPKAAPVQSGRIGQYAREVERVAEQVMGPDFGLEQFRRWQRQPDAEYEMLVTQADVSYPIHEMPMIYVPEGVTHFDEWSMTMIEMPAYADKGWVFADIYEHSFRNPEVATYLKFIETKFGKSVPENTPWTPKSQGPDLAGFLKASAWKSKLDVVLATGERRGGYRRSFRGMHP